MLGVRTEREWEAGRIDESRNIPLGRLAKRIDELPRDRPSVVHCASGYRSAIGASLLLRDGFGRVADPAGGIAAWETSRLQTVPAAAR